MMKANELRIGNLVYIKAYGNKPQIVEKIERDGINGWMEHGGRVTFDYNTVFPIEVNEKILLKSGFEHEPDWHSTSRIGDQKNVFHFNPARNSYMRAVADADITVAFDNEVQKWEILNDVYEDREYSRFGIEIKGLHHLQNIVYDLTGNELEIKL